MCDTVGSYFIFFGNRNSNDTMHDNFMTYQQENAETHSLNSRKNVTIYVSNL